MLQKKILTIQDISCTGRCSITVALPVLSACGIETAVTLLKKPPSVRCNRPLAACGIETLIY